MPPVKKKTRKKAPEKIAPLPRNMPPPLGKFPPGKLAPEKCSLEKFRPGKLPLEELLFAAFDTM